MEPPRAPTSGQGRVVSDAERIEGLSSALRVVCDEALESTRSDSALIFVPDGEHVVCIAAGGTARSLTGWRIPKSRSLSRLCMDTKEPLHIDDVSSDRRVDAEMRVKLGLGSFACAPIVVGSMVAATLEIHAFAAGAYGPGTKETVAVMAYRASRAFRRAIREAGPQERPRLNELPGAAAYHERLGAIRAQTTTAALLVVVLGPPLEAQRLHVVRDVLMGQRASDYPFVIDADAFAVIMPDTPRDGADIAARRIGKTLRERGLSGVGLGTAAIGIDPFTAHAGALADALTVLRKPPPPPVLR